MRATRPFTLSAAVGLCALTAIFSSGAQAQTPKLQPDDSFSEEHPVVVLRALDKITARITELDIPVGEEKRFGTLAITVRYCRTRPPIEPPETFAYLEIDDIKLTGPERVFEGWMVASSPALNALEHAVYDVWVLNCKTTSGDASGDSR